MCYKCWLNKDLPPILERMENRYLLVDAIIRACEDKLSSAVRGQVICFVRQRNGEVEMISSEAVIAHLMEIKRGALERRNRIGDWMADEISLSDLVPASDL
jgi:hypothetical protein